MKKTGLFSRIILATLIVLNSFLTFYCFQLKSENQTFKGRYHDVKNQFQINEDILRRNLVVNLMSNTTKWMIDKNFFHSSGDYKKFDSINFPLLVLRYSELNCNSCMDSILVYTSTLVDKYPNNFMILSRFSSERYLYFFKHMNQIKSHVLNLKKELPLEVEKLNAPYFFLLNSNKDISHLFVPDKQKMSLTKEYLYIIEQRYLRKSISSKK